jgi:thymidylate synthase (FAD)
MEVLDKGHVELVDVMGSDLSVCNAARVSFNNETEWGIDEEAKKRLDATESHYTPECIRKLKEKDVKLIRYLAKHNHWTPFAHPQITLRVKAPISIRTQLYKSKQGLVENEVSRRYVSTEPEFYDPSWRTKPTDGAKQGSEDFMEQPSAQVATIQYGRVMDHALKTYNSLLKRGVAPEQARFVLPQGMYTEWYWTGSLAAFARVYKLRIDSHAQWEVREFAKAISEIVEPLFPVSWNELTK